MDNSVPALNKCTAFFSVSGGNTAIRAITFAENFAVVCIVTLTFSFRGRAQTELIFFKMGPVKESVW